MRKNKTADHRKPEILEGYYQVMIERGIEGASIGKIAERLNIHPSLIIHYFKNKENMKLELVDLMIEKFEAPEFLTFDHIEDDEDRFQALMDTLFSFEWSRTVNPGVHFGFYYLSYRSDPIKERFREMYARFRGYIQEQLVFFRDKGIIDVKDEKQAAGVIITLMEGMEFHAQFLSEKGVFENFATSAKKTAIAILKDGTI
jgi:AcrR family transcriptional regulator